MDNETVTANVDLVSGFFYDIDFGVVLGKIKKIQDINFVDQNGFFVIDKIIKL